jgi:hypothetical protein
MKRASVYHFQPSLIRKLLAVESNTVEQCNLLSYNKKPREGSSEKVSKIKILEKKLKERAMVSTFFIIIK